MQMFQPSKIFLFLVITVKAFELVSFPNISYLHLNLHKFIEYFFCLIVVAMTGFIYANRRASLKIQLLFTILMLMDLLIPENFRVVVASE